MDPLKHALFVCFAGGLHNLQAVRGEEPDVDEFRQSCLPKDDRGHVPDREEFAAGDKHSAVSKHGGGRGESADQGVRQ